MANPHTPSEPIPAYRAEDNRRLSPDGNTSLTTSRILTVEADSLISRNITIQISLPPNTNPDHITAIADDFFQYARACYQWALRENDNGQNQPGT